MSYDSGPVRRSRDERMRAANENEYEYQGNDGGLGNYFGIFVLCLIGGAIFQNAFTGNSNSNGENPSPQETTLITQYPNIPLNENLASGLQSKQVYAIGAAHNAQEALNYKNMFAQQGIQDLKIFYCDCKREARFRVVIDNPNAQAQGRELMQIERSGIADTLQNTVIYKVKYVGDR